MSVVDAAKVSPPLFGDLPLNVEELALYQRSNASSSGDFSK